MTTAQLVRTPDSLRPPDPVENDGQRARIRFRQPVSTTGYVDAAWWPRTRDLASELPPLMDVLWTAGREINRITYNLRAWEPSPRRMQIESRGVRLGGFDTSDPHTVRLSDAWGRERIDILVIAPETDPVVAQRIFDLASRTDASAPAQEILDEANATTDGSAAR